MNSMPFRSVELKTHWSFTNSMNPPEKQTRSLNTVIDYCSVCESTTGVLITNQCIDQWSEYCSIIGVLISVFIDKLCIDEFIDQWSEYWSYLLRGEKWRGGRRWGRMEPCRCVHLTRVAESWCKKVTWPVSSSPSPVTRWTTSAEWVQAV